MTLKKNAEKENLIFISRKKYKMLKRSMKDESKYVIYNEVELSLLVEDCINNILEEKEKNNNSFFINMLFISLNMVICLFLLYRMCF